ncbi:hypothetical protein V1281_004850 [Nitrobacteraceae bacterium AZCC 2161]
MSEDLLRGIAAELNGAPVTAERVARAKALVEDTNARIAAEALRALPFDSSPYGFQNWLATADKR